MALYHCELGFPTTMRKLTGRVTLVYGFHAKQAAITDRYSNDPIDLPLFIDLASCALIEAEVINNEITKLVLRTSYDSTHDIILVVIPDKWFVKTIWLNSKTDKHKTLDKQRYAMPR